jgi:hypothetical protein
MARAEISRKSDARRRLAEAVAFGVWLVGATA